MGNMDDRDTCATTGRVAWGSKLTGFELADGWFQVADRYLPTHIDGFPILRPTWSPAVASLREIAQTAFTVDKQSQEQRMKELFTAWDANGDGRISKEEISRVILKICSGTS